MEHMDVMGYGTTERQMKTGANVGWWLGVLIASYGAVVEPVFIWNVMKYV